MGKLLPEIVEQQLRPVRKDGQRRVVTHRGDGLGPCVAHRHEGAFYILAREAEGTQHTVIAVYPVVYLASAFQGIELDAVGRQPGAIGTCRCQLFFQFTVIIYFTLFGINHQYLSRLQAPFLFNLSRFEIHHAYFTGHYHHVIIGNEVTGRAQAVAVQHPSGKASVTEQQRGRAVPGFHQDGIVFVKRFQLFTDGVFVVERFGYQHCHGMGQAQSRHHKKFQHIVQ